MSLSRILTVFTYELRQNVTRKGFLFSTFGIPFIGFLLMVGYHFLNLNAAPPSAEDVANILQEFDFEGIKKAGMIDQSGAFTEISPALEGVLFRFDNLESAQTAVNNGAIDVFYVIEPNYLETGDVTLHLEGMALSKLNGVPIEQLFYTTLAKDIDPQLLTALRRPINLEEINLTRSAEGTASNFDADFLTLYVFVIVFLVGIFTTNGYLLQSVIEEKENRLIEILISTMRPTELLAGKILALGLVGIIQIVTWVGSIVIMLNISLQLPTFQTITVLSSIRFPYEKLPIMFIYFVLGYLVFAALYGAVGALSSSMREGPGYAVIFTLPSILPFYFFALFTESPNGTLPVILSLFPITSPISMLMRMTLTDVPLIEVIASLALLTLTAFGAMWLAGRLFRVQTLLAGSTPKLRDLPKLLRG